MAPTVIAMGKSILATNNRLAEQNRAQFADAGLLAVNLMSAPGSGKTALLERTLLALQARARCAVIVGDLATDNDAQRLAGAGVPVIQLTTGTVCHLDAGMIGRACDDLELSAIDLLFIENVGNLVCPAGYDLGENLRIVLLSVTEGEDKPLKYPTAFQNADVVIVTKIDLSAAAGCDRPMLLDHVRRMTPRARVFELSCRTGEGMDQWCDFLWERRQHARA